MATATKIGEPARVGQWGLTVDSLTTPTQFIILRYIDEHRRHTEPFEEVQRLPYRGNADADIAALVETCLSKGIAAQLVVQLEAKRHSPKAADADASYRPIK